MDHHVRLAAPQEACGLVGGEAGLGRLVLPVENAAASASRFRMEPAGQLAALFEIERLGLDLVAIYHSHPSGPEGPSSTDLAEAAYPEAAFLIWAALGSSWGCRAFTLTPGGFRPIPLNPGE